jgi:hypothetical protein
MPPALLQIAHCDSAAVAWPDSRGLLHVVLSKRPRRLGRHDRSYAEAASGRSEEPVCPPREAGSRTTSETAVTSGAFVWFGGSRPKAYGELDSSHGSVRGLW